MIIGIILTVIGIISLKSFFSKNEWRAPLIELSAELEENIQIKNHKKSIKYNSLYLIVFFITLYSVGTYLVLTSKAIPSEFGYYILLIYVFISYLFVKGVFEIFLAFFSTKTWLKNYLYSPYFFAWRRDHLSKYSDNQIARAIIIVCKIKKPTKLEDNTDIIEFLINLHRATRPKKEFEYFPSLLELNRRQAENMRYF